MNSGERDPPVTNARSIQHEAAAGQKQQVATIVEDQQAATASKQPAHLLTNHHHQLGHDTAVPNGGEWRTVVRLHGGTAPQHNANDSVMDGSFQQHQHVIVGTNSRPENGPNPSVWSHENYVQVAEPHAPLLTHGNGEFVERSEPPTATPEGRKDGNQQQQRHQLATNAPGGTRSLVMRDPQESHHRPAPPAAAPLGEVESGEDDSDCAVVVSTERKVEPLKINLTRDREPLRTIIKLTPGASSATAEGGHFQQQLSPTIRDVVVPGSPKITIKPPKPPPAQYGLVEGGGFPVVPGSSASSLEVSANCSVPVYSSIPKLTIKPVINPANEIVGDASAGAAATAPAVVGEQMQIIPKLLIKGGSSEDGRDGAMEPHIVPKLTIRGVNNHNHHHHHHNQPLYQHHFSPNHHQLPVLPPAMQVTDGSSSNAMALGSRGDSSGSGSPTPLVPKLTIKMDNYHPHLHHHHNSLRVKDTADGAEGGGPPIPKLHIKTIAQDGGVAAIASSLSPGTSSAGANNCSSGQPPVLTSSEGVKLTIKPLPEPPKLPKLTIKTTGLGTIAETSDASMVSSTSSSFSPKALPTSVATTGEQHLLMNAGMGGVPQMMLLHQHQQHQPASPSDQHSNISSSSIPKLTIKPIPNCSNASTADGGSGSSAASLMVTEAAPAPPTPTVPKLTIKPILPPTKQSGEDSSSSSETSINSLESSPVSSSSISSAAASAGATVTQTSPQTALKMTIKVPPLSIANDNTSPLGASAGLTRLNIKPILPPDSAAGGSLLSTGEGGGAVGEQVVDSTPPSASSEEPTNKSIVIPKVTIKTLAHPRGQETEILSTPKVTLKPIPKPLDDGAGSGHSPTGSASTLGTSSSAATTVGTADVNDSPRIILKINKGSDGVAFVPPAGSSILANELKRPAADRMMTTTITSIGSSSSSSSSSSVSCASSTSVSASATSSSAGSDPASPSSVGGGSTADQGEPDSPEAKKSKLDLTQMQGALDQQQQQQQHRELLRQSMIQSQQQRHQYQLQLQAAAAGVANATTAPNNVHSDVIVIDDDSKSENEATKDEDSKRTPATTGRMLFTDPLAVGDGLINFQHHMTYPDLAASALPPAQGKARRTRGTPRGTGGRQSRRGTGRAAKQTNAVAMPQLLGLLEQDDREEGSSSDCMIVDDPAAATNSSQTTVPPTAARAGLTLENLLRGGGPKMTGAGSNFYSGSVVVPPVTSVGGGSEVDKNGTASNSSIGSVTSSVSGSAPVPSTPTGRTPTAGVRMSTRRAAGQLLKEVLASKHQDRDSGVDEARTDGENGATPSKRTRGRPKKQSVELTVDTNGGGSSNSLEGHAGDDGGLDGATGNSNILLAMAMMGGADGGSPLLRQDGSALLASQQLIEGIVPLAGTPVRTPRTRGRGRGRGRGKLALADGSNAFDGGTPFPTDPSAGHNADPLFIGNLNNADPSATDPTRDFRLLFNLNQTPRGGSGGRTRGGRRGAGSRGPRTLRGSGRGAAKAAMAALLASGATPGVIGSFAGLAGSAEQASNPLLESLQQTSLSATNVTPKTRGRGRGSRGGGTGTASRRKGARGGSTKAARSRKELVLDGEQFSPETPAVDVAAASQRNDNNAIFMTPMAGGLDPNRPKLHMRELKTPKNAIKSNTPPSSAQATPSAGTTPSGTPAPEVFEEDTRMSSDFNFTTPVRLLSSGDGCLQQNDESQSSYLSSTSVTLDATNQSAANATGADGGSTVGGAVGAATASDAQKEAMSAGNSNSSSVRRNKGKMEVLDSHRAQFTVELLAEYEWPPSSPGTRGADTFMIQEQIAEYLGVKSFKRKYPDLMRRPVDMEERNFILEQGLASEKMCDLGLTAVYASEILDIMCTDYPEKYEEYTRYTREKHFRELSNRQRQQQEAISAVVAAAPVDRAQLQKEKAMESAASWNCSFNKERRDSRRACMDLQTYVVQVPKRQQLLAHQEDGAQKSTSQHSNYPVALVPGQFSEYYTTFTPEELACYPINTILLDPFQLQEIVSSERYRKLVAAEEARLRLDDSTSCSSGSSSSSDSDDSSDDEDTSSNSGSSSSSGSCSSSEDEAVSGTSSTDSECEGGVRIKKKHRRKRKVDPSSAVAVGESNQQAEAASVAVPATAIAPVRRSSRTLSAGVPLAATAAQPTLAASTLVECKDPTDSDDSDVPLIAHAVKKKNSLLMSATAATVTVPPSVGGGKKMQEPVLTPVKRPPLNPFMCAVCLGPENKNRYSKPELFVRCNRCRRKAHPSCIGMSSAMYRRVQQYKWQCSECKLCMKCNQRPSAIDSKMVYCDQCDRGYHLACKGLRNLPEGRWHCSLCTICGLCGAQTPEGHPNPHLSAQQRQQLAMVAEWTHEYGLNDLTKIREHLRTLCVPCVRQRRQSQQPPPGGSSSSESIALNNNNNTTPSVLDSRKPLLVNHGAVGGGAGIGGGVISMKPQATQSSPIMSSGAIGRQ
uniref:PHD-type domain-containing protein n=1 Tax=Anopheles dirus TaxID=7168 RepID=A0A182N4W4_9DIPT